MNKKNISIIGVFVVVVIAAGVLYWLVGFKKTTAKDTVLTYSKFTSDIGFEAEYPNWQKLEITNPEAGMPGDLAAKENIKILLYATNGAAVVQISERTFDPKSAFKDNIESMLKNQKELVKDLLIWRYQPGATTSLIEATSMLNGVKMHTVSKAFDMKNGKIYSIAFITADNNFKMFKDIAERVIYSAKVWR
jgi:hypothetical protein